MNYLKNYLAGKHYAYRGGQPPEPVMTEDQSKAFNELVKTLDQVQFLMDLANKARADAAAELLGRAAMVKLQDKQKNPTRVRIDGVSVTLRMDPTGTAYYIELEITLIESPLYTRLRRRRIPLGQLVEVLP